MPFLTANVNPRYIGLPGTMPAELGGGDPEFSSILDWDVATKTGGTHGAVPPDTTEVGVIVGPTADTQPRTLSADGDARSPTQRRALTVHSSIAHNGTLSGTPHFSVNDTKPVIQIGDVGSPEDYFVLEGLHVRNDKRDGGRGIKVHPSSDYPQIHRCISDAGGYGVEADIPFATVTQCLMYVADAGWSTVGYIGNNDDVRLLANTIIGGYYINNDLWTSGRAENCVLFGQTGTDLIRKTLNALSSHNASDYTSITDGGTHYNASDWISIGAGDFVDTTNGNYTPAAGSKLIAAGQDIKTIISSYADAGYTPPVDVDLAGNPRPANGVDWDCGALQFISGGGGGGGGSPTDVGVLLAFII